MVKNIDGVDDVEFFQRILEIYSIEEVFEFNDLEPAEALHLMKEYGIIDFDNIPV